MIFIYNSHIIDNDIKKIFTSWDDKKKRFYCDFKIIPIDVYSKCGAVDFTPAIGKYEHRLIYRYQ
jgi:hypothetical protein